MYSVARVEYDTEKLVQKKILGNSRKKSLEKAGCGQASRMTGTFVRK